MTRDPHRIAEPFAILFTAASRVAKFLESVHEILVTERSQERIDGEFDGH